ncbi:MAG: HDOD domain-containing protein [Deltaproteobacteria bacterium]|nr:MAG: HDOD domain-containing protein [Deltaproteobacteria bacterium]
MEIKAEILKMIQKKESDLPTLPVVVDRIISVASDEKTTTEELAQVISYDQGMTNKLLKLANSIYYAQKTRVETTKRAITIIGFDEIIGIALGMGILSSFTDKSGLSLDMKALWIHGIGVATASKELAKRTNPGIANKIFIPALLHDMGKVILSVYFKDEYMKVRQLAMEKKKPLYFVENAFLKLDHAILSALLMKRWNFPPSIMLPCRFHHNPESAPIKFRHQSLIINLADYLTQKAGIGHSGNPVPVTVKNSPKKIGVSPSILKLTIDHLKRKEDEIKEFFNITTEP